MKKDLDEAWKGYPRLTMVIKISKWFTRIYAVASGIIIISMTILGYLRWIST